MSERAKNLLLGGLILALLAAAILYDHFRPKEQTIFIYSEQQTSAAVSVISTTEQTTQTTAETSHTTTKTTTQKTTKAATEKTTRTTQTTIPAPLNTNLNTATAEDLQRVSGIGERLSAAIIAYRTQLGGFTSRQQLLEISGIGEELAARIMAEFVIPNEQFPQIIEPVQPEDPPQTEPPVTETLPITETETEPAPQPGFYDLNLVTKEELMLIPGMDEALADDILYIRELIGGYTGIYELNLSKLMDGKYFEYTLRDYLYIVGDPLSDPALMTDQPIRESAAG